MTELSFLVELLLNHKLPKVTKDLVASRIKEVEQSFGQRPQPYVQAVRPNPTGQAASTLAAMERHANSTGLSGVTASHHVEAPLEQGVMVSTPAAAAAVASRQQAINAALSGKIDKVNGRPRKF